MPHEYGVGISKVSLGDDVLIGAAGRRTRDYIVEKGQGKVHFIACTCSFFYEDSLAGLEARYGFDFANKSVVFFGDGYVKITTSTWPQVRRTVAKLFAPPILPNDENDKSLTLSHFQNDAVITSSFTASQKNIFEPVLRASGDKKFKWTVTHEDTKQKFDRAVDIMNNGNMVGFAMRLYTHLFYKECGRGLPEEDLDEDGD